MKLTRKQVQHAIDNLEDQEPFLNPYAFDRIMEVLKAVLEETSAEVAPEEKSPKKKGKKS